MSDINEQEFGIDSLGRKLPSPTDSANIEFEEWAKTAAVGDLQAVCNYLQLKYDQLNNVRKDYISKISMCCNGKDLMLTELKTKVYPMLQRIEDRTVLCKKRIDELYSKPLEQ